MAYAPLRSTVSSHEMYQLITGSFVLLLATAVSLAEDTPSSLAGIYVRQSETCAMHHSE